MSLQRCATATSQRGAHASPDPAVAKAPFSNSSHTNDHAVARLPYTLERRVPRQLQVINVGLERKRVVHPFQKAAFTVQRHDRVRANIWEAVSPSSHGSPTAAERNGWLSPPHGGSGAWIPTRDAAVHGHRQRRRQVGSPSKSLFTIECSSMTRESLRRSSLGLQTK